MFTRLGVFWLSLCAAIFLLPSAVRSQTDTTAPFIYYYSVQRQAFIVERADGSESRILASYALPDTDPATYPTADTYEQLQGPGWSPSGRWFAWMNRPWSGSSHPGMSAFVVDRAGAEAHAVFDTPESTRSIDGMLWAHHRDLLLIQHIDFDNANSGQVSLYDPFSRTFLRQIQTSEFGDGAYFNQVFWTPDDQNIVLVDSTIIVIFPVNGDAPRVIQAHISDSPHFGSLPYWFEDNRIAYLDQNGTNLIVEAYETGRRTAFPLPTGVFRLVDWSPDGNYGLIYIQTSEEEFRFQLYLLSLRDQSITPVSNDVDFPNHCGPLLSTTAWSTHGQAVFTSQQGELELLTVSPVVVSKVQSPLPGEVNCFAPIRLTSDGKVMFSWRPENSPGSQIYIYDPQTDETTLVVPRDRSQVIVANYFAPLRGDNLAYQGGIINLTTGAQTPIMFQSDNYTGSFGIEELFWHPTEPWLLLAGSQIEFLNPINVIKADGTMQRELALCPLDSASCFGWMPDEM